MNQYRQIQERFRGTPLVLNIVLDGYGLGPHDQTNAIWQAQTPNMHRLMSQYANTSLLTHGPYVGLPGATDLGGSEVGHLTLGAGMVIDQGPTLITKAIADGSFQKLPVLRELMARGQAKSLHLLGLLSDGNVHSHIDHFIAVIEEAVRSGVSRLYLHALMDGRDVAIQSADQYALVIQNLFDQINQAYPGHDYCFASGGGREVITMDRDKNWAKVEKGYQTHILGKSGQVFGSILEAIAHFRSQRPDLIDQDMPPFNIQNAQGQIPCPQDGDAFLFMNFRADRAVQFSQVFEEADFPYFDVSQRPQVYFAGMMIYDEDTNLPQNRVMGNPSVPNPFGRRILEMGLQQFRLAETQKFAHVTFFYNGGYRNPLDASKEEYCLINSDRIDSFANAPKMKALEISQKAVEFIRSGRFQFGLINFANADMVGHTGDMAAAITAAETVDFALGPILQALEAVGGVALITADHGNADEMLVLNKKTGKPEKSTKHSINPVPLILFDPKYKGDYQLKTRTEAKPLRLSQLAATNYLLLGREIPQDLDEPLFAI